MFVAFRTSSQPSTAQDNQRQNPNGLNNWIYLMNVIMYIKKLVCWYEKLQFRVNAS